MLTVAIGAMLWVNWSLALYSLLFIPLFPIVMFILRTSLAKKQREAMERASLMESHLVETTTGMETVKTFAVGRQRVQEAESRLVQMAMTLFSVDRKRMVLDTTGMLASGLGTLLTLQAGAERVIAGQMTIGSLLFFYTLMGYMFGPIERLASSVVLLQDASVAMERLWEILSLDVEETPKKHPASVEELQHGIRLKEVTFRYGYRGDILKKLDLFFPAGKTVALVGESGCGKSTICKLLAKLYEASEGQILIDDMDLRDFPAEAWRRSIGYVGQEPYIFSGTVAENIAFGKPNATLEEIAYAAEIAGLDAFIQSLPERYETMLGERGLNLSGGQRQRLAIARAVVLDPQILIFDEASSHLDTATEQSVFRSLFQSLEERVVILVAHRLSTVASADIVCVISDGAVIEQGSHETLLARRGAYWKLWRAQNGGAPDPVGAVTGARTALAAGSRKRSVAAHEQ
jgi:ATP-binding cassette subfamily B protein